MDPWCFEIEFGWDVKRVHVKCEQVFCNDSLINQTVDKIMHVIDLQFCTLYIYKDIFCVLFLNPQNRI